MSMVCPSGASNGNDPSQPLCSSAPASGLSSCREQPPAASPLLLLLVVSVPLCLLAALWSPSSFPFQCQVARNQCLSRMSYLLLKCTSLLLESSCSKIVDNVHHGPVCGIGRPPIFHGPAKYKSSQSAACMQVCTGSLPCLPELV